MNILNPGVHWGETPGGRKFEQAEALNAKTKMTARMRMLIVEIASNKVLIGTMEKLFDGLGVTATVLSFGI